MSIIPIEINFMWDEGPDSSTIIIITQSGIAVTDIIAVIKAAHKELCRDEDDEDIYGTNGRNVETLMNFICEKYHPEWMWKTVEDAIDLY